LDDEDVVAADVLVDADRQFTVGESTEVHLAELDAQVASDLLGETAICGPRKKL
jgi:hypothetical protein